MRRNIIRQSEGQVLLVTLLVLTIAVTIALALIARTTTDLSISNKVEDSARAFNAAEAGIEDSLRSGQGSTSAQVLSNGSQYTVSVASIGGATGVYTFPQKTLQGTVQTLWLASHNATDNTLGPPTGTAYRGNSIDVCWSQETVEPALEVSVWLSNGTVFRRTYDPDATRRTDNGFITPTATSNGCGNATMYRQHIVFATDFSNTVDVSAATGNLRMMRIRAIYADTNVAIDTGTNTLPEQGKRVESVGTSGAGVTRRIVVYQQFRAPLNLFDNVLYSQQDLSD